MDCDATRTCARKRSTSARNLLARAANPTPALKTAFASLPAFAAEPETLAKFAETSRLLSVAALALGAISLLAASCCGVCYTRLSKCFRAFTMCLASGAGSIEFGMNGGRTSKRRSGKDRRNSGVDIRTEEKKKAVGERRSSIDRRSGVDRRSGAALASAPRWGPRRQRLLVGGWRCAGPQRRSFFKQASWIQLQATM